MLGTLLLLLYLPNEDTILLSILQGKIKIIPFMETDDVCFLTGKECENMVCRPSMQQFVNLLSNSLLWDKFWIMCAKLFAFLLFLTKSSANLNIELVVKATAGILKRL
jgi:hypothetical protein